MADKKLSDFLPARTPLVSDLIPTLRATDPAATANDVSTIAAIGALGLTGVVDARRDFGAQGDDTADDTAALQAWLDAAFGPVSSPNGIVGLNQIAYLPPGYYKITAPLQVKHVRGGIITGGGRFTTTIKQHTADVPVFQTNGFAYSRVEGIRFYANGNAACVDLDWDGSSGGAALQSNTFSDCFFQDGAYGLKIGQSAFMGSETAILNCFFLSQTVAGVACLNANALQQTILGGNFQGCAIGVWTAAGSCNVIHGVGFQLSTTADIQTEALANNTMSVQGCRSESTNFIVNNGAQFMHIGACSHTSGTATLGDFYFGVGGQATIAGCDSVYGCVRAKYWAQLGIEESIFQREDWLQIENPWAPPDNNITLCIEIRNIRYYSGTGAVFSQIRRQRILADVNDLSYKTYNYDVTVV